MPQPGSQVSDGVVVALLTFSRSCDSECPGPLHYTRPSQEWPAVLQSDNPGVLCKKRDKPVGGSWAAQWLVSPSELHGAQWKNYTHSRSVWRQIWYCYLKFNTRKFMGSPNLLSRFLERSLSAQSGSNQLSRRHFQENGEESKWEQPQAFLKATISPLNSITTINANQFLEFMGGSKPTLNYLLCMHLIRTCTVAGLVQSL